MASNDPWTPSLPPQGSEPIEELDPRIVLERKPGAAFPGNPPPPEGWEYWKGPVPKAAGAFASRVQQERPLGSFVQAVLDGQLVAARKEWHNHQGATNTAGIFVGTSLFRPTA